MNTDEYYMGIAIAVREKANCLGRKVGAVLVKANRIISAGYNGTPEGVENCLDGGCVRCAKKEQFAPSVGYDVCICVHAEENALITAARFGISVEGATACSTMRPCFTCTRAMLQAKIQEIFYLHDWRHPDDVLKEQYELLQARFPHRVKKLSIRFSAELSRIFSILAHGAKVLPRPISSATRKPGYPSLKARNISVTASSWSDLNVIFFCGGTLAND